MLKILKNKKAINDVTLIWTIIVILFSLGIFVPFVENYYSGINTNYNLENIKQKVGETLPSSDADESTVNAIGILFSIITMFFWNFSVHWGINLILLEPMRIILYILIYRQIRSGGG